MQYIEEGKVCIREVKIVWDQTASWRHGLKIRSRQVPEIVRKNAPACAEIGKDVVFYRNVVGD